MKRKKPEPKRKPAKTPANKAIDPAPENKAIDPPADKERQPDETDRD